MTFQDLPDFDDHEEVRTFDLGQGARAVIAVHSTYRGPAAGGTRVWTYASDEAAMTDALRLSRGMSYKNAMAELPFGGGKSVISLPANPVDRQALFEAFGRAVETFKGRYIAAEDVGSSVADMQVAATQTRHVAGLPQAEGQAGGDPSPWTALGVFGAVQAALAWRDKQVAGATVAIQGTGAVGSHLARHLARAGAKVIMADINEARTDALAAEIGGEVVPVADIYKLSADVFAPCALGAILSKSTVPHLGAAIVCGAANNQLATDAVGAILQQRGVLYCPDYLVNAGGIIAVQGENAGYSIADVDKSVRAIPARLTEVLSRAAREGATPEMIADRIARARMGRGSVDAAA